MPKWIVALLACSAVLAQAPAPESKPPAPPFTAPADAAELLLRLQGIPKDLPGWGLTDTARACDRECLPECLPREAEGIMAYHYLWSLHATFLAPAPRGGRVQADVFALADDLDAFGLFACPRPDRASTAAILTQSYWNGPVLHIWRGHFYVRLTPGSADGILRAGVLNLGENLAARLPLPEKLPLMMRQMPDARSKAGSLRYLRKYPFGEAVFDDVLTAEYLQRSSASADDSLTLTLFSAADAPNAARLFEQLCTILAPTTAPRPLPGLGAEALALQSEAHGLSYLMREGGYVVLARGVVDRNTAEGLLRITATSIRILR